MPLVKLKKWAGEDEETEQIKVDLAKIYKITESQLADDLEGTGVFFDGHKGICPVTNSFNSILKALQKHAGDFAVFTRHIFETRVAVKVEDIARFWEGDGNRELLLIDRTVNIPGMERNHVRPDRVVVCETTEEIMDMLGLTEQVEEIEAAERKAARKKKIKKKARKKRKKVRTKKS